MKKYESSLHKLENKRSSLLMIGLMVSISLVLLAFKWKGPEKIISSPTDFEEPTHVIMGEPEMNHAEELPDPPVNTEQPVFIEPPTLTPIIVVVNRTVEPDLGFMDPDKNWVAPGKDLIIDEPDIDVPQGYWDVAPEFPGGIEAFYKFLKKNLRYPEWEKQSGNEGTVHLEFIINKDGSITDVNVALGATSSFDAEAVRVIKMSPKWTPGKQNGKTITAIRTVPISFVINR
jgi:protein TonB